MTYAAFPAATVLAAASVAHDRLKAAADADGIRSINPSALYRSADLARFAAAVGDGPMYLDLDDFGLIASDLPAPTPTPTPTPLATIGT